MKYGYLKFTECVCGKESQGDDYILHGTETLVVKL